MKRSSHPVSWAARLAVAAFIMVFAMIIYGQGDGDPAVITAQSATSTPIRGFAFPVVPNASISGYFDHKQAAEWIQFYDGRANPSATSGYTFSCPALNAIDWVGCENAVQGEPSCPNYRELWYDHHTGIDFEYFPDWHTGVTCDRNKFENRTWHWPIFSASNGQVNLVEWSEHNGRAYRILHDHNGDGNAANDGIRAWYLHLTFGTAGLQAGDDVKQGSHLADGAMTGKAYTPHLHFEVQKLISGQWRPVDPYGWAGSGSDPHPDSGASLWSYRGYSPMLYKVCPNGCPSDTVVTH